MMTLESDTRAGVLNGWQSIETAPKDMRQVKGGGRPIEIYAEWAETSREWLPAAPEQLNSAPADRSSAGRQSHRRHDWNWPHTAPQGEVSARRSSPARALPVPGPDGRGQRHRRLGRGMPAFGESCRRRRHAMVSLTAEWARGISPRAPHRFRT
jgi:hypothetical protein